MKELEYFRRRSIGDEQTGCWNWTGCVKENGYGSYNRGGGMEFAHRGAWAAVNGSIPAKGCICHVCDNRLCVNPDHLFLGTQKDNMADAVSKGRQARGSRVGGSRLTEHDVSIIKWCLDAGVTQRKLAALYGVAQSVMAKINTGKSWTHVEPMRFS